MALNDRLLDRFIQHDLNLQRLQAGQRRLLLKELKALEAQIVKTLQSYTGQTFTKARQQALLRQVRATIQTGYRGILKTHQTEVLAMAEFEAEHIGALVNRTAKVTVFSVGVPESVVNSLLKDDAVLGAPLRAIWAQEAGALNQAFISAMRQGILAGETTDQLVRRVQGTKALQYKDGIMNPRTRAVEMRVRTSAQSILNDARMEVFKNNGDVLNGVQAQVTLDDRTSAICMARSGFAWDLEGNPLEGTDTDEDFPGPPPWHPNCRTTLTPIVKSLGELVEDKAVDKKVDRALRHLPERTQASMDGQVPRSLTYEEWLNTKSDAAQQEILGPGKYTLWKAGKISLRDLIDQRGNPLTLQQLRKL